MIKKFYDDYVKSKQIVNSIFNYKNILMYQGVANTPYFLSNFCYSK